MEERCRGVIGGTIPALVWRNKQNNQKPWKASRSRGRDLNPGPSEYEGVLTTTLRRSVLRLLCSGSNGGVRFGTDVERRGHWLL